VADLRAEGDHIGEETAEFEMKLQQLREETERYKQLYAEEVRKKIEDKALVETQRQVLAQVSSPMKSSSRPLTKQSQSKRLPGSLDRN
jgi:isopropylmalate/homocitrate/citramalate synthase